MRSMIFVTALFAATATLTGCGEDPPKERWVLVKVCVDGTHIFRRSDGTFRTGGVGAEVENPDTVCASGGRNQ